MSYRSDHNETRDVHRDATRAQQHDDDPMPRTRAERLARRDRLTTAHRYSKGGLWDKGSQTLKKIPILGQTALQPMTKFLDTTVNLYTATHDKQGHSHYGQALKDAATQLFKFI